MVMDFTQAQNLVVNTTRSLVAQYQNGGHISPQEANMILNIFGNQHLMRVAQNVYNICVQYNNPNVDTNQLTQGINEIIAKNIIPQIRQATINHQVSMQQQMPNHGMIPNMGNMNVNTPMVPHHGMGISTPQVADTASLYGYAPSNVNPAHMAPPAPQHTQEIRTQVQGRVEMHNPSNIPSADIATTDVFGAVKGQAVARKMPFVKGIDINTVSVSMQLNTAAMTIVESMDDNESGIRIVKSNTMVSDHLEIDNSVIEIDTPFTNHSDPCKVALDMIKSIPVFSTKEYYAHVVKYHTLHDIPVAFNVCKTQLDNFKSFITDDALTIKWNSIVTAFQSATQLMSVKTRFDNYLNTISKCVFSFTDTTSGNQNAVVLDGVEDIPLVLDKDGDYKFLVETNRLYRNACDYMYHVYNYIFPGNVYLNPHNYEDYKVLVNRPDRGLIYKGQLLRYNDGLYTEVEVGESDKKKMQKVPTKSIVDLLSKSTTMLQRHIVLVTNIPFNNATIHGIANDPKNRIIVYKPNTLLECILSMVPSPIFISPTDGVRFVAGKNIDNDLTIAQV